MQDSTQKNSVVYLLGIMPRSGTNFLSDLICRHPACGTTVGITEDFLFANAHHLDHFVADVYASWDQLWGDYALSLTEPLYHALGQSLENYLYAQTSAEWINEHASDGQSSQIKVAPTLRIARTPSAKNLDLLHKFTDAKVVLIVRDGRAVVESGMRSFGWLFEERVQEWAQMAALIQRSLPENAQIHCVRYEDLYADQARELRKIFRFLEIDAELYDYTIDAPVRGSSTYFDQSKEMNWGETKKGADFNPLMRWQSWNRAKKERFHWIAGAELERLGYTPDAAGGPLWTLYNVALDFVWPLRNHLRTVARKVIPKELREQILWSRRNLYRRAVLQK